MSKKIVLIAIILAEVLLGSSLIYFYSQKLEKQNKVLGVEKVVRIDRSDTLQKPNTTFNYYYELKPNSEITAHPEWLEREVVYSINDDGLHDGNNYEILKKNRVFRIVALGDSYTYGQHVNTAENWTELLENSLNTSFNCPNIEFEVINLGMQGFDIPYLVERYKRVGAKYNPDLVIWYESSTGFSRYLENLYPLIDECISLLSATEKKSTQEVSDEEVASCWSIAQKKMYAVFSYENTSKLITASLDSFFTLVDQKKLLYVVSKQGISNREELQLLQSWQQRYPFATIITDGPSLVGEDLLFDKHPSVSGHKTIANFMESSLKERKDLFLDCE